ncbi:hypothetical protein ACHHYP_08545 [Achlya hypogyna]|uniref:Secreted protein n=1 Tax=Achlya hypogyna TaxID=1202772 RepID=A0A1V9YPF2_ACHHY|nr:hypothetical protein ACHHYP_08545 [Achlya hypogyna]
MSVLGWSVAVFAVAAVAIRWFKSAPTTASSTDKYFSENYFEARALFRASAAKAHATLHTLPLPDSELTIDVAVLRGADPTALLVHLSGTHGVEGFAGSAIQAALLANPDALTSGPTVVFVHAVNPFGFAKLRRVNEHNVDLNRNYLSVDEFRAKRKQDPNRSGYMTLSSALNPPHAAHWANATFLPTWVTLGDYSFQDLFVKRAIVSGTYHVPTGLFFGGQKLEPSHQLLTNFFTSQWNTSQLRRVAFLDVHTGLGPAGFDTVEVLSPSLCVTADILTTLFPGHAAISNYTSEATALSGFEEAVGLAVNGYLGLFPNAPVRLGVTQEFGTKNIVNVLVSLRKENAAMNHAPGTHLAAANELRDAFYLHWDSGWKEAVIKRGTILFHQLRINMQKSL